MHFFNDDNGIDQNQGLSSVVPDEYLVSNFAESQRVKSNYDVSTVKGKFLNNIQKMVTVGAVWDAYKTGTVYDYNAFNEPDAIAFLQSPVYVNPEYSKEKVLTENFHVLEKARYDEEIASRKYGAKHSFGEDIFRPIRYGLIEIGYVIRLFYLEFSYVIIPLFAITVPFAVLLIFLRHRIRM
jgi:hypothetical protein